MRKRTVFLSLAVAALFVAPTAMATWRALGSVEPDTALDRTGGWMFADSNEAFGVNKVYFNVVSTQYLTATNPNMALEGSRILSSPTYTLEAFYGVWVDCNQDGYIGMADTALLEYRVELAPGHICGADEKANMHNQQGWVSELRWIGDPGGADGNDPDDLPDGRDARLIKDWGADIWGDNGLPGDQITVAPTCSLFYHRTGQVANYLDCRATIEAGQGTDAAGAALGFAADGDGEVDYDQPHAANVGTFGDEDAAPAAKVWDCSSEQSVNPGTGANQHLTRETPLALGYSVYAIEYTDSEGNLNLTVYRNYNLNGTDDKNVLVQQDFKYHGAAPAVNPSGSVAAAWNQSTDGLVTTNYLDGDCDPSNGGGNAQGVDFGSVYLQESPEEDVRIPSKRSVTYEFSFFEEQRSGAGKRGEPFDRGVYPGVRAGVALVFSGSRWFGGNWNAATQGNSPAFVKTDLSADGARYMTFYANVTASTVSEYGLVLPAGGATGTYGAEWCFGATTGVAKGFNCDPDQWYINPDGSRINGRDFAVFAGHQYNLRDVDCYDWRVGTTPVYASGATIDSAAACAE